MDYELVHGPNQTLQDGNSIPESHYLDFIGISITDLNNNLSIAERTLTLITTKDWNVNKVMNNLYTYIWILTLKHFFVEHNPAEK